MKTKGLLLALIVIGSVFMMGVASANGKGADTSPRTAEAIYYEGVLYGTILTPTNLPDKAPVHSFDILYNFGGEQPAVASSAPGEKDYNGGRWIVYAVTVNDNSTLPLTNVSQVLAEDGNSISISNEPVRLFVCPMKKLK